jgi:hypothetical protein
MKCSGISLKAICFILYILFIYVKKICIFWGSGLTRLMN